LLALEDLNELTIDSYAGRARTGFESARFNYRGLFDWETEAVAEAIPSTSRILIAAAGGGREAIALARAGHDITAFDAAPDLVEACRMHMAQAGLEGAVHYAPAGEVPEGLEGFDALIIGRGSLHHIPGRAQRIAFLKACRRTVAAGAPMLLGDFLVRPDTSPVRASGRGRIEAGDFIGSSFYHHFTRQEVALEFDEAGFELTDIRHTPFSADSKLCHAIGRAR
jgi:hypothetical protein